MRVESPPSHIAENMDPWQEDPSVERGKTLLASKVQAACRPPPDWGRLPAGGRLPHVSWTEL